LAGSPDPSQNKAEKAPLCHGKHLPRPVLLYSSLARARRETLAWPGLCKSSEQETGNGSETGCGFGSDARNMAQRQRQAKDVGQNKVDQDEKRGRGVGFIPSINGDQEMCRGKAWPKRGRKTQIILPALPLPHPHRDHHAACSPRGSISVADSLEFLYGQCLYLKYYSE